MASEVSPPPTEGFYLLVRNSTYIRPGNARQLFDEVQVIWGDDQPAERIAAYKALQPIFRERRRIAGNSQLGNDWEQLCRDIEVALAQLDQQS